MGDSVADGTTWRDDSDLIGRFVVPMDDQVTRPLFIVVTTNLMDRGPFEAAGARVGYRVEFVRSDEVDDVEPLVAFVDLETAGADGAIGNLAGRGVRVIAYGPHVDDVGMVRARSLGAGAAEPRSRALTDPGKFLPPLV